MLVGGEAAVPPRPSPPVVAQVAVFPIRHVGQATGRYTTFALVLWYMENYERGSGCKNNRIKQE